MSSTEQIISVAKEHLTRILADGPIQYRELFVYPSSSPLGAETLVVSGSVLSPRPRHFLLVFDRESGNLANTWIDGVHPEPDGRIDRPNADPGPRDATVPS